jgi:phytanoyl-CoA hydroxylase
MAQTVYATAQEQYEREGYVVFRQVLPHDLIGEAQAHVDWLLKKYPDHRPEDLHHTLMTNDAFWVRLVSDSRLLDIVERFIGPDIGLFASHYIAKRPRDGKSVPWHQDGSYWPLEPMEVITLWLAVDRSDQENGCMRILPGTQHARLLSTAEMTAQVEGSLFDIGMDPASIDETRAVDLLLDAGDVSIHHPNVIHGSHANHSERWRRGLTIRYIPTTTRILAEPPHHGAFIFRGAGVQNGNGWNPLPPYVAGEHMPFRDTNAWNATCAELNERYRAYLKREPV